MPSARAASTPDDLIPPRHIRTLLFDWDGTLFDNHAFNFRALRHGLAAHGIAITGEWFHANSGFSAEAMVLEAARLAGAEVDPLEVLAARDRFADARLDEVPAVVPVMALLGDAGGRRVGVVTGSHRSNIAGLLALHGLEERLDVLVTRDELRSGKPDPEGYRMAMHRLEIEDPASVLVYEDSDQGVEAALAAGADVVDVRPLVHRGNAEAPAPQSRGRALP